MSLSGTEETAASCEFFFLGRIYNFSPPSSVLARLLGSVHFTQVNATSLRLAPLSSDYSSTLEEGWLFFFLSFLPGEVWKQFELNPV